ncbi:phosphotransferase [Oerskovia sp. M15]
MWRNNLGGLTFRWGADRYVKWVAAAPGDRPARRGRAARVGLAARGRAARARRRAGHCGRLARDRGDRRGLGRRPALGRRARHGRGGDRPRPARPARRPARRGLPFSWSVEQRIARADERIADGEGPSDWFPEHAHLTVAEARPLLDLAPPVDRLVVCHGDTCAPNTLMNADGSFAAHVDLGSLGVADRWADLAVAAWSTEWNYGPGYDGIVYEAYGIEPDKERITYYRLLWDLA